jgi:hypothetical protein
VFGYVTKRLHVSRAGKGLAGWNPRQAVAAPSLSALPPDAQEAVDQLAFQLFLWAPSEMTKTTGKLYPLQNVLMAALLKDLTEHLKDVGLADPFMVLLSQAASRIGACGISIKQLKEWGSLIADDFNLKNRRNADAVSTSEERQYRELTVSMSKLSEKVFDCQASNNLLAAKVDGLLGKVDSLLGIVTDLAENLEVVATHAVISSPSKPTTGTKKRARVSESPEFAAHNLAALEVPAVAAPIALLGRDPGPPHFPLGIQRTTVIQFFYQLRTHGIQLTESKTRIAPAVTPQQKARARKVWMFAKDAVSESNLKALFVDRRMVHSGQVGYQQWCNNIKEICTSVVESMIPKLQNLAVAHSILRPESMNASTLALGAVATLLEKVEAVIKRSTVRNVLSIRGPTPQVAEIVMN